MKIVSPELTVLNDPLFEDAGIKVSMLRLDLIHPFIHGNKYFKLKYNIEAARREGHETLLSFGGAYSNHIYALAAAGKLFGFKTIGVIRGEELNRDSNEVLRFASAQGMQLAFVTRESYRHKHEAEFIAELHGKFGPFYYVPEGGSNELAVKGAAEIPELAGENFDYICCACGTGGTLAGISTSLKKEQKAIGITVVNAPEYFNKQLKALLKLVSLPENIILNHEFHFGSYGKVTDELLLFRALFQERNGIMLDKIYNAKLCFGIYKLIGRGFFKPGSEIVIVNTGGFIN